MPEFYRNKEVVARQFTRCHAITITNPLGGLARVSFYEEEVTQGASIERKPLNPHALPVLEAPYEPDAEIALIDPATGQPSGQTVKESLVYLALFSRYMAAAKARDDAANNPPAED
jgi:hypothetical protein